MGQRPNELTPHQSLQHYWGAELRTIRVAHEMPLSELASRLHCDTSYLARVERAERTVPAKLAKDCDEILNAGGALVRLHELLEASLRSQTGKTAGQANPQIALDGAATAGQPEVLIAKVILPATLDTREEVVVPARASDGRVIFVSVPRRLFIQGLGSAAIGLTATPVAAHPLTSTDRVTPPPIVEDVNPIEHFQTMMQALVDNDNLFGPQRVIPAVREQITLMQQLRSSWDGADQRELLRVQAQYSDFCGWLYQDTCEYDLAESLIDRALALSQMAGDDDLIVFILARKAELAGDMRVIADAIGAGEQALRMAPPRSQLAAVAATYTAHGYALNGDHVAMERTYDRACELLSTSDPDPNSPCPPWFDENDIALQRARSLAILGNHHCAAQNFVDAIAKLPGDFRRGRGVYLARAAVTYACEHEVEQAATLGLDALTIGTETGSGRIFTELTQLNDVLARWDTVPAVADFRAAMKDTVLHRS